MDNHEAAYQSGRGLGALISGQPRDTATTPKAPSILDHLQELRARLHALSVIGAKQHNAVGIGTPSNGEAKADRPVDSILSVVHEIEGLTCTLEEQSAKLSNVLA